MEVTNRISYDINKSAERIDDILNSGNGNFSDEKNLPERKNLTYKNGYYVNITAIFIDMVGSSDMTDEHKRPVLAKIYRSFISECTAIMNADYNCKEININGDCVWGVYDSPYTKDIDSTFGTTARLNSLIKILNYKLSKKGYSQIDVGIGIDYGKALMVKAGYSGSGLNNVIWMGDVVNSACHIANKAGRNGHSHIIVSDCIYSNLCDEYQKLLTRKNIGWDNYYEGDVVDVEMENWYKENCND